MSEMTVAILIVMAISIIICGFIVWLGKRYRKEYDKNSKSVILSTTAVKF